MMSESRRQIHHARAEHAHDLHQAMARCLARLTLISAKLRATVEDERHVLDREHVHQLVDIGFHAVRRAFADLRDDGHARNAGPFRVADGQRFDVVGAPAE